MRAVFAALAFPSCKKKELRDCINIGVPWCVCTQKMIQVTIQGQGDEGVCKVNPPIFDIQTGNGRQYSRKEGARLRTPDAATSRAQYRRWMNSRPMASGVSLLDSKALLGPAVGCCSHLFIWRTRGDCAASSIIAFGQAVSSSSETALCWSDQRRMRA